ncbi:MAG: CarD family transcriptional regulator [Candidatus Gracilibacteria bacterium]|nr:CarD family transcriptional regulator [Candidatus Gracilibacteria bacterium]
MLQTNTHYKNIGNTLYKTNLIKDLQKSEENILLICENEISKKEYIKIFSEFSIDFFDINNYSELINLISNKTGFFIVSNEIFSSIKENMYEILNKISINIEVGKNLDSDIFLKKLIELDYNFSDYDTNFSYKKSGDTITINLEKYLYKISLWGDSVEEILLINKSNLNFSKKLNSINIGKNKEIILENSSYLNKEIFESINKLGIKTIFDNLDFSSNYEDFLKENFNFIAFDSINSPKISQVDMKIKDLFIEDLEEFRGILKKGNIKIYTKNKKAIENFLKYNEISNISVFETKLNNLKSYISATETVICDDNISRIFVKKRIKKSVLQNFNILSEIKTGDNVVHIDHGIAKFCGIIEKDLSGIKKEYLELEYKGNDKLFVPVSEIYRVSKYVGVENPDLTGLNTKEWDKKLKKASEDIEKIAEELLEIYAKRKMKKGFYFMDNKIKQIEFQKKFPYNYTADQLSAIEDIMEDMSSEKVMDRILIGDVGFGKTEVIFNAIFKAFLNKKQSILVCPLVVLAYEHYEKALSRFRDFDIKIGILTRMETEKSAKLTLKKLETGEINLVIGTHRLLSEDVKFKDLGLVVIDEEHKFGVNDKEKISKIQGSIDMVSVSATPIPRSLNMALNGIREVSVLNTRPVGRHAIETYISKFEDEIIIEACNREFDRNGQIFFIHNRVTTIEGYKNYLEKLFPNKKIVIAHGQLSGNDLEDRIMAFKRREYDILLSTTVIENGIDFSNVNTIIIDEAYNFGISQIHQLRGRVGRSDKQGYCYMLYRKEKLNDDAAKRLKTIVDYNHLGAGFELALRDLELRGGGDILGLKQSGNASYIGINLFIEMLEDKIEEMKKNGINTEKSEENKIKKIDTSIDLNIGAMISGEFFSSELDKINFYRDIENINSTEDLNNLIEDFKMINENFTDETQNLFDLMKLKIKASKFKIKSIKKLGINYQIDFVEGISLDDLKAFLKLDTKIYFTVVSLDKLRCETKKFKGDLEFLHFILNLFEENKEETKKRIKLKK